MSAHVRSLSCLGSVSVSDFVFQDVTYLSSLDSGFHEVLSLPSHLGCEISFLAEMSIPECGVSVLVGITCLIVMSLPYLGPVSHHLCGCVTRYGISVLLAGLHPLVCDVEVWCLVCKVYEVLGICVWRSGSGLGFLALVGKLSQLRWIPSSTDVKFLSNLWFVSRHEVSDLFGSLRSSEGCV